MDRPSALLERLAATVKEVAAREIRPRFRHLETHDVIAKPSLEDPADVVTAADQAAEAELVRRLPELVPGSRVIGEEGVAADPSLLLQLSGAGKVWLVDPLDGTRNFAEGRGPFGTMVALLENGVCLAACVYSVLDDLLLLGERGLGAFVNGARIKHSETAEDPLTGTISHRFMPPDVAAPLIERAAHHRSIPSPRCAVTEYSQVALGQKHYAVYYRLLPWDHVPGALIVREAGGVVRHLDGREYELSDVRGPLLVASSPFRWQQAARGFE